MTPVSTVRLPVPSNLASLHVVSSEDDVGVALREIEAGEAAGAGGHTIQVIEKIPRGHKVALRRIVAGALVHTGNLATSLPGLGEYRYEPASGRPAARGHASGEALHATRVRSPEPAAGAMGTPPESFMGYRLTDGRWAPAMRSGFFALSGVSPARLSASRGWVRSGSKAASIAFTRSRTPSDARNSATTSRAPAVCSRYFLDNGQPIYENPSPGNIAGGITTLEDKSLGAVQKGGRAPVTQVLRYGECATRCPGLALLEAPGNDAVSCTALVAAGATVLLFTTGRGTPLGFPVPTLKISSNSALAAKKPHWIDFDAGAVLAGKSMQDAGEELLRLVVATASGAPARNEVNGEREISIWKSGVTL